MLSVISLVISVISPLLYEILGVADPSDLLHCNLKLTKQELGRALTLHTDYAQLNELKEISKASPCHS